MQFIKTFPKIVFALYIVRLCECELMESSHVVVSFQLFELAYS